MQQVILKELHEGVGGGRLGQDKTLNKLKERYYWTDHFNVVQDWCQTCPEQQWKFIYHGGWQLFFFLPGGWRLCLFPTRRHRQWLVDLWMKYF